MLVALGLMLVSVAIALLIYVQVKQDQYIRSAHNLAENVQFDFVALARVLDVAPQEIAKEITDKLGLYNYIFNLSRELLNIKLSQTTDPTEQAKLVALMQYTNDLREQAQTLLEGKDKAEGGSKEG